MMTLSFLITDTGMVRCMILMKGISGLGACHKVPRPPSKHPLPTTLTANHASSCQNQVEVKLSLFGGIRKFLTNLFNE